MFFQRFYGYVLQVGHLLRSFYGYVLGDGCLLRSSAVFKSLGGIDVPPDLAWSVPIAAFKGLTWD